MLQTRALVKAQRGRWQWTEAITTPASNALCCLCRRGEMFVGLGGGERELAEGRQDRGRGSTG